MLTAKIKDVVKTMEIIKNRTAIEAFDYILFNGTMAVAFNGTVGIVVPLEVSEPFSVPMQEFGKIVRACRAEEVDITVAEEKVHIKCGRLRAHLVTNYTPESDFGEIVSIGESPLSAVPREFLAALEMCARTSSNSVTMDVLNSVYVNNKEVVGSDDARLTVYNMGRSIGRFILPYTSIKDIVKFRPIKCGANEGWVLFEDDEQNTMAVRTVEDNYPDYKQLFDVETSKVKVPAAVTELIASASVFSETGTEEEYSEAVFIRFKKGGVVVRSENHMGKITNSVKCSTGIARDIEIAAHPKMFVEALALSDGVVCIGEDRIIIESEKIKHAAGLQDAGE
jgi:DNA polymerase III sliding clamp (beta) subunit (PCNA family)